MIGIGNMLDVNHFVNALFKEAGEITLSDARADFKNIIRRMLCLILVK